jgi:hypothetical protein
VALVPNGLRHPARGRLRNGAEDADTAVGVLDDGEDVLALPGQSDSLDEVAGEQRFDLGAQKVGPDRDAALGRGSMPSVLRISQKVEGRP